MDVNYGDGSRGIMARFVLWLGRFREIVGFVFAVFVLCWKLSGVLTFLYFFTILVSRGANGKDIVIPYAVEFQSGLEVRTCW